MAHTQSLSIEPVQVIDTKSHPNAPSPQAEAFYKETLHILAGLKYTFPAGGHVRAFRLYGDHAADEDLDIF